MKVTCHFVTLLYLVTCQRVMLKVKSDMSLSKLDFLGIFDRLSRSVGRPTVTRQ